MLVVRLTRFAYLPQATLGRLEIDNGPTLYTIERPWKDNRPYLSCIPTNSAGYELEWDRTGRIKDVPRLRHTNPRTQINIHAANYASELHGCIAPGLDWRVDGHVAMVLDSQEAMDLLLECTGTDWEDGQYIGWVLSIVNEGAW